MGVSFHTLEREEIFKNPPSGKPSYPLLNAAVSPHIGSFNALMDGPDGGLLNLAVKDIGSRVVFDSKDVDRLGNKLKCE
jgi:DNA-directed RNA polymerase I subunit RPA2